MKKLFKFFKNVYLFLFYLTPKGKEAKYYDQAFHNMKQKQEEEKTISEMEKRMLQGEINWFINSEKKRRILTADQKSLLILNKFAKKLKNSGYKIDPSTHKLVHA